MPKRQTRVLKIWVGTQPTKPSCDDEGRWWGVSEVKCTGHLFWNSRGLGAEPQGNFHTNCTLMWKCWRGCSDKKSVFSCQSSTLLKFLDLSMMLKAKQSFFFDKHGDNECPKPFDRKFARGHVNSSRDLAGCPLRRADVTSLAPSCQISPSYSWWFSVPSHASFILHGCSAMWQLTGFLFHC